MTTGDQIERGNEGAVEGEGPVVTGENPTPKATGSDANALPRWNMVSIGFRAGLALVALLIGGGVFVLLSSMRSSPAASDLGVVARVVETVRASTQRVHRPWVGYGTARAMDSADVSAEVAGRVIERPASIEPGLSIEPGQVMFRLDPHDYLQRVSRAEELVAQIVADLEGLDREEERMTEQVGFSTDEVEIAQRDYERTLEADAEGAGSPGGIDQKLRAHRAASRALAALRGRLELFPSRRANLNARLEAERANLRLAQRDLDRTVITSPVGGVLQSATPEVGEWVTVGQGVARVVDLSTVEIPLRVPVSAGGSIESGDGALIESGGVGVMSWEGSVMRMAPEADDTSRTMTVFIEVEQSGAVGSGEGLLRPGQFVMGRVSASDEQPRLLIPRRAVIDDRVLVARADSEREGLARVEPVSVRVLYTIRGHYPGLSPDDTEWAVVSVGGEIRDGDSVISSNLDQLRAGMLIDPRDAVKSGAVETTVELGGS